MTDPPIEIPNSPAANEAAQLTKWVTDRLSMGILQQFVAQALLDAGWTRDITEANSFVAAIDMRLRTIARDTKREAIRNHLLWGTTWAGGGGVLSLLTYSAAGANPSGGTYYVFYGAIVYGGYRLLLAAINYLDNVRN